MMVSTKQEAKVYLSPEQIAQIGLLSDTVLYPEAVSFVQQLIQKEHCNPLPTSQVNGLLNVALSSTYDQLYIFVVHQRDRDWPPAKRDIKTFYTALERFLTTMKIKRLRTEFHLLTEGLNASQLKQESDTVMALMMRDFIQHLVAENGVYVAVQEDARARERGNRR